MTTSLPIGDIRGGGGPGQKPRLSLSYFGSGFISSADNNTSEFSVQLPGTNQVHYCFTYGVLVKYKLSDWHTTSTPKGEADKAV